LQGELTTDDPIETVGHVQVEAAGGLHVDQGQGDGRIHLRADRAVVETAWERGVIVEGPDSSPRIVEEDGTQTTELEDVLLSIGSWREGTEVLVTPASNTTVSASGTGASALTAVPANRTLAQGGYSDQAEGTSDRLPSYTYRSEEPIVAASRLDQATAAGSMELFANNATLEAETEEVYDVIHTVATDVRELDGVVDTRTYMCLE